MASKVYYHLGAFEDSLTFALGAGDLFDVNARTEYVETTLGTNLELRSKDNCQACQLLESNPSLAKSWINGSNFWCTSTK